MALDSLLSMNGIGITKIDDQFFKAVPANGINVHVPIWLDGPANLLSPSQRIYIKMLISNMHLQPKFGSNLIHLPPPGSVLC